MVLATRTEWRNVLPTVSRLFRRRDSFSVNRTNWSIKGKWDSRAGGGPSLPCRANAQLSPVILSRIFSSDENLLELIA